MAIFSKILVGACALASMVHAFPLVKTVTDYHTVTVWETINSTTTIWQPLNASPSSTTTSTVEPAVPPPASPITSTTSSVAVQQASTPTTTPVVQVQQPADPPNAAISQPQTTTLLTSTTGAAPRSADTAAAAAASAGSFASTPSTGGVCQGSGAACTGDITHWDGGLGACGWSVNTASDMQIALPVGLMGSQSNGNPYCGRSVSIKDPYSGQIILATVGDKCMGCPGYSFDATNVLFTTVTGGKGDGRVSGVEWWFN